MKESTKDNLKAGGEAAALGALSLIPIVGAPIKDGISEFVASRRAINFNHFQDEAEKKIKQLGLKLNDLNLKSEGLEEIVESIYEEVEKTRMQEKRALFAQALVNSIIRSQSSDLLEEKEFINLLTIMPFEYMKPLVDLQNKNDGLTLSTNSGAYNFLSSYGVTETSVNVQGMTYGSAPVSYTFKITAKGLRFIAFVKESTANAVSDL